MRTNNKKKKSNSNAITGFKRFLTVVYKSKPEEKKRIKACIGILIGILFTVGFHYVIVRKLKMTSRSKRMLLTTFGCCFCIGGALSVQMRCIMLLIVPTFFGRSGRGILATVAFSLVLTGPIENISKNMEEVGRVFGCATNVAINTTLDSLELLYNPVHDVMRAILVASHDIHGKVTMLGEALRPMFLVVDEEDIEYAEDKLRSVPGMSEIIDRVHAKRGNISDVKLQATSKKLLRRLQTYCLQMISVPMRVCNEIDDKLRPHFDSVDVTYTGSCPSEIREFCDDVQDLGDRFDEEYATLLAFVRRIDRTFAVAVEFAFDTDLASLNFEGLEYTKERIEEEITYRKKVFDFIVSFMGHGLSLLFLLLFANAANYQRNYLNKIDFDNRYITWYFRKIDKRRKKQGKMNLLPLNPIEKRDLIGASNFKLLPTEKKKLWSTFIRMTPQLLTIVLLFLIDHLIAYALYLIGKHALVDFHGTGEHRVHLTIKGESLVATQLRLFLGNIESTQSIDVNVSTELCLPRPSYSDPSVAVAVLALHLLIFVAARFEAYGLRLRRITCASCYYKREKQRVLSLYNKYLRKRKGLVEYQTKRIRKSASRNSLRVDDSFLLIVRLTFPRYFNWLRVFSVAKRKCLICEAKENESFHGCPNCKYYSYCDSCFKLIQGRCLMCHQRPHFLQH